jgi:hypothetical protein
MSGEDPVKTRRLIKSERVGMEGRAATLSRRFPTIGGGALDIEQYLITSLVTTV